MTSLKNRASEALDLWENTTGITLDMAFVIYGRREASAILREFSEIAHEQSVAKWLLLNANMIENGQPLAQSNNDAGETEK